MSAPERFAEAVELATELSGDYLNFNHALNRARSLMREGWAKHPAGQEQNDAVRAALLEAANVMPIETLLGADKASVWLRDYAERWGKQ